MRKLFIEWATYAKGDGDTIVKRWVEEDTLEARQNIVDDLNYAELTDEDDFLSGEENILYFDRCGGDWDDPTGGYYVIQTYEESLQDIEDTYVNSKEDLNRLFGDKHE